MVNLSTICQFIVYASNTSQAKGKAKKQGITKMMNLENLEYLHLQLIQKVATRLNVSAQDVVNHSGLEAIIYSIQDDAMASLECLDLMADLAIKRHEEEIKLERELREAQTQKARAYWENLLSK